MTHRHGKFKPGGISTQGDYAAKNFERRFTRDRAHNERLVQQAIKRINKKAKVK